MTNRTLSRTKVVSVLALTTFAVTGVGDAFAAKNPSLKCRGAVAGAVKGLVTAGFKALDACHKKRDKTGAPADCNDIDGNAAVQRALSRGRGKVDALCQPSDPVLQNYPEASANGVKNVLLPTVIARIEASGTAIQGSPTIQGDKRLAKCHGAIGKGRTATVGEMLNASLACQKRLDKGAPSFSSIAPECISSPGAKSAKALGKITQLCSGVDGTSVGSCASLPDCVSASATADAQQLARLAFGGAAQCGNGIQELGETCDDGNTVDGDACPATCNTSECGNGVREGDEVCDDGFASGNEDACLNSCEAASCGDGFVQADVEECDDAAPPEGSSCVGCQLAAATCGADGLVQATVEFLFSDEATRVGVVRARLDYPDFLQIPGSEDQDPMKAAITDLTGLGYIGVNDNDAATAVTVGFLDFDGNTEPNILAGPLYRAQLQGCAQGTPIRPPDFACVVEEASTDQGIPIEGTECRVVSLAASGTPPPLTTSTTLTTTTSSAPPTTAATTSSTILSALCGNGMGDAGETCDDGNTLNEDGCPSDCVADACEQTLNPGGALTVTVDNTGGTSFGLLTVFVDYPEGLVFLPGSADDAQVQAAVTDRPTTGSPTCLVNDRDHGVRFGCLSVPGFPEGTLFRAAFRDCANAGPPAAQDFGCKVIDETTDPQGNLVTASCTVSLS